MTALQAATNLVENLHGSGIDAEWEIKETRKYVRVSNSYHRMNDAGYYCGWYDFTVMIKISDPENWYINWHGNKKMVDYYGLHEYLEDEVYNALRGTLVTW